MCVRERHTQTLAEETTSHWFRSAVVRQFSFCQLISVPRQALGIFSDFQLSVCCCHRRVIAGYRMLIRVVHLEVSDPFTVIK